MFNEYLSYKRLEMQMACAYNVAHSDFKYLPIRFVINLPKQLFEATLARQVAIYFMRAVFNIQKGNQQLEEPYFVREYEKWAGSERSIFQCEMNEWAEAV